MSATISLMHQPMPARRGETARLSSRHGIRNRPISTRLGAFHITLPVPMLGSLSTTSLLTAAHSSSRARRRLGGCWVDKSEDVVEDVIASLTVGKELEGLDIAHRSLLCLDLYSVSVFRTTLRNVSAMAPSYQKCSAHNNQNAASLVAGLCIESGDLVLDLLEWQLLYRVHQSPSPSVPPARSFALSHTFSLPRMLAVPWCGEFSKVSMELSCCGSRKRQCPSLLHRGARRPAYVEGAQLFPVGVEGLVVELDELLCTGDISMSRSGVGAAPRSTYWRCSESLSLCPSVTVSRRREHAAFTSGGPSVCTYPPWPLIWDCRVRSARKKQAVRDRLKMR